MVLLDKEFVIHQIDRQIAGVDAYVAALEARKLGLQQLSRSVMMENAALLIRGGNFCLNSN